MKKLLLLLIIAGFVGFAAAVVDYNAIKADLKAAMFTNLLAKMGDPDAAAEDSLLAIANAYKDIAVGKENKAFYDAVADLEKKIEEEYDKVHKKLATIDDYWTTARWNDDATAGLAKINAARAALHAYADTYKALANEVLMTGTWTAGDETLLGNIRKQLTHATAKSKVGLQKRLDALLAKKAAAGK
jgi:hypothetical protein